jgi:hypothetical protein
LSRDSETTWSRDMKGKHKANSEPKQQQNPPLEMAPASQAAPLEQKPAPAPAAALDPKALPVRPPQQRVIFQTVMLSHPVKLQRPAVAGGGERDYDRFEAKGMTELGPIVEHDGTRYVVPLSNVALLSIVG